MIKTVSISDFRDNLSDYLAQIKKGDEVIIKDYKKDEIIAQISNRKQFDMSSFKQVLGEVAGTFTAQKHPEWKTRKDISSWVRKTRKAAQRTF